MSCKAVFGYIAGGKRHREEDMPGQPEWLLLRKKCPRPPDVVKRKPRSQTVVCRQFGYQAGVSARESLVQQIFYHVLSMVLA